MVARVTTRKQKMDESAYLHCILKFREESEKFSFLKNRGAGISSAVADNNIIRKGII